MKPDRIVIVAAAALIAVVTSTASQAWTLKTLYSFCSGGGCPDGLAPYAGLRRDASGNLYGTTESGGANFEGVVFELIPDGMNWTYKVLHSFCSSCGDGDYPWADVIVDVNGSLYGTTSQGGANDCGTVFRLTPNADRSKWKEKLLHSFSCAPSGSEVVAGLTYQGEAAGALYDGASPLFGTTFAGGTTNGTVFEIAPRGTGWKETDLYMFCPNGGGCTDGSSPYGDLILDASGNLYGTTEAGGNADAGVVYELSPNAKKTKWSERVLYSFCSIQNCADGSDPEGALVMDNAGHLFGAAAGGNGSFGAVYKLAHRRKAYRESVLYTFCSEQNCVDGFGPQAAVIMDASGNLFGTTSFGGTGGNGGGGTAFELSGSSLSTLYDFCSLANCADGDFSLAPLIMDGSGNLYGTTVQGGSAQGGGTVFELMP